MDGIIFGAILMVAGMVLLIFSAKRNKKTKVTATNGSMAVGGNNSGVMFNINQKSEASTDKAHGSGLTIVAIGVELVGIGVTIWHAMHLAGK